ncbi:MAG TPA: AgmX/PglI C-terminal domain-containing protein, partial [Candidatus Nanopelagicales bacterium]|nr:AgmX/PglI C-terminal domain-containing protein [Candidatus Nanopelagicales bacterium]
MTLRCSGLFALPVLVSLGCAAATPEPAAPAPAVEVAVVDLTAGAGAPKAAAGAKPGKPAEAGAPVVDRKAIEAEMAKNAGILGVLREDTGSPESAFGSDAALTDEVAKGNLSGDPLGDSFGAGGLGLRGSGVGGGGTGEGTIGLGSIGGLGHGAGPGTGSGYGSGSGRLGGRATPANRPEVRTESSTVVGTLPKEVIQRIIRRNINQIRYCYERGLQTNPNLEGKVVVEFTIGKDGAVVAARDKGSTLQDKAVASCVVGRFLRMQFPQPAGGGIVIVTYP